MVLHSRYLSGPVSGENRVVRDEARLLRSSGHRVELWTPSPEELAGPRLIRAGFRAIRSRAAATEAERLVRSLEPDVVHVHNLFPMLSPEVLPVVGRHVPVVMTLHNYRLLCLPANFLRDGQVCELCMGRVPWRGVVHRCYRGSSLQSAALATSIGLHRAIESFESVELNLPVSRFVREKYLEAGFPPERLRVKPNFAWESASRSGAGDYFLFAGRLSPEKGLATLLELDWPALGRLVVAGDGPQLEELERRPRAGVELVGELPPDELSKLLAGARALLVPSLWYEGAPRAVLEAFAAAVPVVASRIGGLPELVEHSVSGLLPPPGDALAWEAALGRLLDDEESLRLGQGARRAWSARYSPSVALPALERAYRHAIGARTRSTARSA
jgi:glycosyltransferase involved in cell wall biosynthesis